MLQFRADCKIRLIGLYVMTSATLEPTFSPTFRAVEVAYMWIFPRWKTNFSEYISHERWESLRFPPQYLLCLLFYFNLSRRKGHSLETVLSLWIIKTLVLLVLSCAVKAGEWLSCFKKNTDQQLVSLIVMMAGERAFLEPVNNKNTRMNNFFSGCCAVMAAEWESCLNVFFRSLWTLKTHVKKLFSGYCAVKAGEWVNIFRSLWIKKHL